MAATEAEVVPQPLVRAMRPADAEAALALSAEAGWNQTAEDWRFMLGDGRALGVYEPGRGWVASSLVVPLGPGLAWISMVLVAANRRRRGFGTMLLQRCIEAVRADGAVPGLDATEFGLPVYLPLGFEELYPISRWVLDGPLPPIDPPSRVTVRDLAARDMPAVLAFDEAQSRMRRAHVLRYLRDRAPACVAERDSAIIGYAMGRPGRTAAQIGPVIADDPVVARALVARMGAGSGASMLDVPDSQGALSGWLRENGAVRQRGYTRMTLGRFPGIEAPGSVHALAGPELA